MDRDREGHRAQDFRVPLDSHAGPCPSGSREDPVPQGRLSIHPVGPDVALQNPSLTQGFELTEPMREHDASAALSCFG